MEEADIMEPNFSEVNVDELMKKIRQEVAKRKKAISVTDQSPFDPQPKLHLRQNEEFVQLTSRETQFYLFAKRVAQPFKRLGLHGLVQKVKKLIPDRLRYSINFKPEDFTQYHDEEFLRSAYQRILEREPDAHGFDYFLTKLRNGQLTKIEILGRIRYSREGREKSVKIKGLLLSFFLNTFYKVPVAGYILRLITATLRLPIIIRDIHEFEAFTNARFTAEDKHLNALSSHIEQNFIQLTNSIANKADTRVLDEVKNTLAENFIQLTNSIANKADTSMVNEVINSLANKIDANVLDEIRIELGNKANFQAIGEIKNELADKADAHVLNEVKAEIDPILKEIRDHKLSILDQQRRLRLLLEEAKKRLPEPFSKEQIENIVAEEDHLLDALYVTFENQFRGTREDIKGRLRVYLPYIGQVKAGANDNPILDLGCGRGEWLEMLKEEGLKAHGVDINRILVEQCREYGLDVVEGELIHYLRSLPSSSHGAVTGFHIIEHLKLKLLLNLIDETIRVLKPGGVAIFETPNPENVLVGSCNFYLDPTHNKPLPSPMMKFLAEARGLCRVEILNLHPRAGALKINGSDLIERFNEYLYGPQDYALIGFKG